MLQPILYVGRDQSIIDHFRQILECNMTVLTNVCEIDTLLGQSSCSAATIFLKNTM